APASAGARCVPRGPADRVVSVPIVGTWWRRLRAWFVGGRPLTREELWGYRVWGPILAFIFLTEILAAASKTLKNAIPWPTISSTVGHLEARWPIVAVLVVGGIAAVAYHAVADPSAPRTRGGRTTRRRRAP